jgi:hypothetical protein
VTAFTAELDAYFRSELGQNRRATARPASLTCPRCFAMPAASSTHLVLIPQLQPRPRVLDTVRAARRNGRRSGSSSMAAPMAGRQLQALAAADDGLRVIVLPENRGKGAAVLEGITQAGPPASPTR